MNGINVLYSRNGMRLVMTNLDAGRIGPSYDRFNINRKRILNTLGLKPESTYFVSQKHSKRVVFTEDWAPEPLTEADGIISSSPEEAIAVTIADCMPIFLHDRRQDVRAILHSGWKGTGIVLEALQMMKNECGSSLSDITAVLGPAIGSCCYNVDKERAMIFRRSWGDEAVEQREGTFFLSLERANRNLLQQAGVDEIISVDRCTSCSSDLGSFRREGPENFTQMFCLSYLNEA